MTDPARSANHLTSSPRVLASGRPSLPLEIHVSAVYYLFVSRVREIVLAFIFGGFLLWAGLLLALAARDDVKDAVPVGLASAAVGLFFLAGIPITALRQLKDGFSVGADHTGVYLRPFVDSRQVVFVPWEGVEGIYLGRWRGPQLVVKPCDTSIEKQFAIAARPGQGMAERWGIRMAQRHRIAQLGSNIHAGIPGVNKHKLLTNLRYYADGRTPVIGVES